eukprot:3566938-Rhodomonas_salina.1
MEQLGVAKLGREGVRAAKRAEGIGVPDGAFVHSQQFSEWVTDRLGARLAADGGMSLPALLELFGEFWIEQTLANPSFGAFLRSQGRSVREFMAKMDDFHLMLKNEMPGLQAPSFRCSSRSPSQPWEEDPERMASYESMVSDDGGASCDGGDRDERERTEREEDFMLHYWSVRPGLVPFVQGCVRKVARQLFDTEAVVEVQHQTSAKHINYTLFRVTTSRHPAAPAPHAVPTSQPEASVSAVGVVSLPPDISVAEEQEEQEGAGGAGGAGGAASSFMC